MQLNADKTQVHCCRCNQWKNINTETLWIYRDDEVCEIQCITCGQLLGYDYDIPDL